MSNGILPAEGFLTIRSDKKEVFLRDVKKEKDVVEIFKKYKRTQVREGLFIWRKNIMYSIKALELLV